MSFLKYDYYYDNFAEEQSFLTYESWRCFFTAKDLQEAWPVLKSALKEYGISCALDLVCYNKCCF